MLPACSFTSPTTSLLKLILVEAQALDRVITADATSALRLEQLLLRNNNGRAPPRGEPGCRDVLFCLQYCFHVLVHGLALGQDRREMAVGSSGRIARRVQPRMRVYQQIHTRTDTSTATVLLLCCCFLCVVLCCIRLFCLMSLSIVCCYVAASGVFALSYMLFGCVPGSIVLLRGLDVFSINE